MAYASEGFNVGITDYWFSEGNYFNYKAHQTTHVWEANVGYDFGFLSVQWFTNFAGNDGLNRSGKRAYSSYFEIVAPFRLAKLDWTATIGAVPYATTLLCRQWLRRHQPLAACHQGLRHQGEVSPSHLRQVDGQSLFREALPCFGFRSP